MLFDNGNQCNSITGGWEGYYTGGTNSSVGSATIQGSYLQLSTWGYWVGYAFSTVNTIDLSGYSNIVFEIDESTRVYNEYWCTFDYGIKSQADIDATPEETDVFNTKTIYKYDITNVNQDRISLCVRNGCSIKCSKIYLEK